METAYFIQTKFPEKAIEDYSNFKKERLYSNVLEYRDKETFELIKEVKLIYTSYNERTVLDKAKCNNLNATDLSKDFLDSNKLIYDYFGLSLYQWDKLEDKTYIGICGLAELLELKNPDFKFNPYVMPINELLNLIVSNLEKIEDIEAKENLSEFLGFSIDKQDLIIHNISLW